MATLMRLGHDSNGSEEDEEDETEVEDLLWGAQMDFIGHRNAQATAKLHQAVSLGSSAACATLANLLVRGLREPTPALTSPTPISSAQFRRPGPVQPQRQPSWPPSSTTQPTQARQDGLAAAHLFIRGLEFELAKPHAPAPTSGRVGRAPRGVRTPSTAGLGLGATIRASELDAESESEEDGAERTCLTLERSLDLVVGLTDCYRYGILQPIEGASESPSDPAVLWVRGAQVAEQLLQRITESKPSRADSNSTIPLPRPPPPPSAHAQLASSTLSRSDSPRRTSTERSYTHPSTSIPTAIFFPPHSPSSHSRPAAMLVAPQSKLRLTIQVHLPYLLALQNYSTDRPLSELYWAEIAEVANATGGAVGTKEGNAIVASAARRLQASKEAAPDLAWKLSKRKTSDSSACLGETIAPVAPPAPSTRRGRDATSSGDALVDMWYERRHSESETGRGKERQRDHAEGDDEETELASSAITIRPSRETARSTSIETVRARRSTELKASVAAIVNPHSLPRGTPKISKFHFATDFPASPPDTPSPSSPESPLVPLQPSTASPHPVTPGFFLPESPVLQRGGLPPRLRRLSSTASFNPPTLPRLLRRADSSASLCTLPPDFSSIKAPSPQSSRDWRSATQQPVESSSPALRDLLPLAHRRPVRDQGWSESFWSRLTSFRETSNRVATTTLSRLRPQPPSAKDVLRRVLVKDDKSAGPGMYWADAAAEENQETTEVEEDGYDSEDHPQASTPEPPSTPPPVASGSGTRTRRSELVKSESRPQLSQRRSFVDVTSPAPSPFHPKVVFTPPTPDRKTSLDTSLPIPYPTPPSSISSSSRRRKLGIGIDPLLAELERESRVGVKTTCKACQKTGLNFPANRNGETFCSRECRLGRQDDSLKSEGEAGRGGVGVST